MIMILMTILYICIQLNAFQCQEVPLSLDDNDDDVEWIKHVKASGGNR